MKSRNGTLAALLNVASPGLGFLYLGRPRWTIGTLALLPLLFALGAWTRIIFVPIGFAATGLALLGIWLASIFIAARMARRQTPAVLAGFQRWYFYAAFFGLSLLFHHSLMESRDRLFGYETFRFPSASMHETLLWGDCFISDTWRFRSSEPRRGELVVFRFPGDPERKHVKRVIGLPGETVQISDGEVRINGARLDEPYVLPANNRGLFPGNSLSQVPEGSYFVLGDNRDNSYDSRSWGPLPRAYLHGSVEFIWFSFHWPEGLRAGRLGSWPK